MLIRLPVTRSRRCEQITAFGASEVPLVKISAHGVSTSGSRPGSSVPTAASAGSSVSPTTSTGGSSSRIDARRSRCRDSVITRPQSVWSTSRRRCSPRRVWFSPTTAPPISAAPPNANRYSGTLSSRTATWRGRSRGNCAIRRFAQRAETAWYSAWVHTSSPDRIAGRGPITGSVALRRSSAAAFGATSGACPGAGTDTRRGAVAEPDMGVTLDRSPPPATGPGGRAPRRMTGPATGYREGNAGGHPAGTNLERTR